MALIKCPECGREISDTAKNCPNCGFSLSKNGRKNNFKIHIIKNKKLIVICFVIIIFVSILYGLRANEKYPLDSKTIGKQIAEDEIEHILKNKNVKYSDDGDWKTLRYLKEMTMEDIPMSKTIIIEDNKIISVSISVTLQTNEMATFQNDTTQNIDTSAELEEKGKSIFNKLVSSATKKYGNGYEYEQEPYDELRDHEEYVWALNDGVVYRITALWGKNENGDMIYSSIGAFYMNEDL